MINFFVGALACLVVLLIWGTIGATCLRNADPKDAGFGSDIMVDVYILPLLLFVWPRIFYDLRRKIAADRVAAELTSKESR